MKKLYLVTGGTGHLGTCLTAELLRRGEHVRVLVRPGRQALVPQGAEAVEGDVAREDTLAPFFDRTGYDSVTLLHCAAMITIASKEDRRVWDVNVNGTENVIGLARRTGVERVVYVSSVHAIPERPHGETIREVDDFSPHLVNGQYARSKAAAAQRALAHAREGLNMSIVHPSGIIGPGDHGRRNHMVRTIRAMASGRIPVSMEGGYDFVDVRDVADGILSCEEHGQAGECYILSGHYVKVRELLSTVCHIKGRRASRLELPHGLVRRIAPIAERLSLLAGDHSPLLTPYSVYTLHTNGRFSHEKASRLLGYKPRGIVESIRDSL